MPQRHTTTLLHTYLFLCFVLYASLNTPTVEGQGFFDVIAISADVIMHGVSGPNGLAIDEVRRILYVSDTSHHRVLRYDNIDSLTDTSTPTAIFGQKNSTLTNPNQGGTSPTQSSLNMPKAIWVDSATGTLWVADQQNNRILWWLNAANRPTNSPADGVIGQTDFVTKTSGLSTTKLSTPFCVTVSGNTLWVCDSGNKRVLRFDNANALPTINAAANGVIGAVNFISNNPTSIVSASTLLLPTSVIQNQDGLYIVDNTANRILYYTPTEASKSFGAQAAYVYGQSNFSLSGYGYGSGGFSWPTGMGFGPDGLFFVADNINSRIMIFASSPPKANLESAVSYMGVRYPGEPFYYGYSPDRFHGPLDVKYDSVANTVWVADGTNSRICGFYSILPSVDKNLTNVELKYEARQPNARILPKDANGQTYPGQFELFILPSLIEEVDSAGNVVQAESFPLNYAITSTIDAKKNQIFDYDISTSFSLRYTLFNQAETITNAGVTFTTSPSALKFEMSIHFWNWTSTSHFLKTHLSLYITPNVTSISQSVNGNLTTFTLLSSPNMTTTLNLIGFGVLDGVTNSPVTFGVSNATSDGSIDLIWNIPYFSSSFQYDPDFSVSLGGGGDGGSSSSGGGGTGGDGNADLLPLLALIALVIPFFLITVVAIATVTYCVIKMVRTRQFEEEMARTSSVNL